MKGRCSTRSSVAPRRRRRRRCRAGSTARSGAQIARYEAFLNEQAARAAAAAPPLVPARCVYHLWMVHMLQPAAYRLDCETTCFDDVVPHEYPAAPPPPDGCAAFQAWESARAAAAAEDDDAGAAAPPPPFANVDWWLGLDGLREIHTSVLEEACPVPRVLFAGALWVMCV